MKLKLTHNQKVVIGDMRNGIKFYFNPFAISHAYSKNGFGFDEKSVNGNAMKSLEKHGLIEKGKRTNLRYEMILSEFGETIKF